MACFIESACLIDLLSKQSGNFHPNNWSFFMQVASSVLRQVFIMHNISKGKRILHPFAQFLDIILSKINWIIILPAYKQMIKTDSDKPGLCYIDFTPLKIHHGRIGFWITWHDMELQYISHCIYTGQQWSSLYVNTLSHIDLYNTIPTINIWKDNMIVHFRVV